MRLRVSFALRIACLATATVSAFGGAASAQLFNQFVGFGDSTLDSGWYFTHAYSATPAVQALYNAAVAAGGGVPTTPGGRMNSTVLASLFGLTATPVGEPGGTNYAAGGAVNVNYPGYTTLAPTTVSQIQSYLAAVNGAANPSALYMISSGGNDINGAICPGGHCVANANQLALNSAAALSAAVAQLQAAGGRYFVVPIAYGANPNGSPSPAFAATESTYNRALYADLAAAGVNFVPVSGKVIADAIAVNPALFGLTNVTPGSSLTHTGGACINPDPVNVPSAWAAVCTRLVAPNAAQTYLYADNLHYSAAGQLIEAEYAYSLIVAPTEISYLAEVPVKTRSAVVNSIFQQIEMSTRDRAVGTYNAWVSGDLASLSVGTNSSGFPGDPGIPVTGTAGIDYQWAPGWLLGAAISVGTTTQSFSLGGGFQQNEFSLSAYTAYLGDPFWFDMIATFGVLHDDVNRVVPVGIASITNTGSTLGTNTSFAGEVGYNFHSAPPVKAASTLASTSISYGPLAGIVLQHIDVNGFTESDPFAGSASGGFTALSFGGQIRNSAVTELGLQAGIDVGVWHPFGKLVWNHELISGARLVTATEPEIAFAPAFSMPAVILGTDWGTATLGTSAKLGRGITGYASLSSQFGQGSVTYYGAQVGFNVALALPSGAVATP